MLIRNRIGAVMLILMLLLLFQLGRNEFVEPNPANINVVAPSPSTLPFVISEYIPSDALTVWVVNAQNTATLSQYRLRQKQPFYYQISLVSGDMKALDYREQVIDGQQYCLGAKRLSRLREILRQAEICDSPEAEFVSQNISCRRSYTLPFVILVFKDQTRVNLGEKQTDCDHPTMLCGAKNTDLTLWAREILLGVDQLDCGADKN